MPESEYVFELKKIFSELDRSNVQYFLLRDRERVFEPQKDMDLFVSKYSKKDFLESLKKLGWLQRKEKPTDPLHSFYFKLGYDFLICLDVKFELKFGSAEELWSLDEKQMLTRRVSNGFFHLDQFGTLLVYFAHICKEKSQLQDGHFQRLTSYCKCAQNLSLEETETLQKIQKMAVLRKIDKAGEVKIFEKYFKKEKRSRNKKGLARGLGYTVGLIGTDGVGKSTLAQMLPKMLNIKSGTIYLGQKQWAISFFEKIYRKKGAGNFLAKWIFYPADIFLRVLKASKNGQYRIFFIDRLPGFPILSGGFLGTIYRWIIPKIDLLVLLEGAPEKIWERKKEDDLNSLRRDAQKWEKVYEILPYPKITVNTDSVSVDQSAREIIRAILADKRFENRLFSQIEIGPEERQNFRITEMQSVIFSIDQYFFKVPFSMGSYKELQRESVAINKVKKDDFFNNFLSRYKFFGPVLKMERFEPLFKDSVLIPDFFEASFFLKETWPEIMLKRNIAPALERFLRKYPHKAVANFLENFSVPCSSIHGDLHFKNMMQKNGQLFLVDWSNYQPIGCRYFDLLSFVTTKENANWAELSFELAKGNLSFFGQVITRPMVAAYCLWRIGKELRELDDFGRLTNQKVKKYDEILNRLCLEFHDIL